MKRRGMVVGVSVSALVAASLTASLPAVAAPVSAMNTVFTPPAAAAQHALPPVNAPSVPWVPVLGGGSGAAPQSKATRSTMSAQTAPSGTTVGAPGLGSLPYFGFDKSELSLDLVARVNLANGNLLLTDSDAVLTGPGESIRADRFYNGLSTATGSFGGGWSSTVSQSDFGLSISGSQAVFHGPSGFSETFTKSGSTWTTPAGFNATLTENDAVTDARYVIQYNKTGEKLSFTPSGWITSDTDRNGIGDHYAYDSNTNHIKTVTGDSGRQITLSWSGNTPSAITGIDDSAGRHWGYTTNSSGQLSQVTKPGNLQEQYTYDSSGRVATIQTSGAQSADSIATFGYDSSSRVTSVSIAPVSSGSTPAAPVAKTTYAYASGSTTLTDGNGHATTYTIDSSGRVTKATDALGHARSQTYTSNSDVQSTTDALGSGSTPGNQTTYSYDSQNNLSSVKLPTGAAASAAYGVGGNCPNAGAGNPNLPKCTTDAAGNSQALTYDSAGNLTSVKDSTTNGTGVTPFTYTYEKSDRSVCGGFAGQVCSVKNGNGNTTTYSYDANGNLTKITRPAPLGTVQLTSYDSLGRVTTVVDGKGQKTLYEWGPRDNLLKTTYNSGSTVNQSYYNNGTQQTTTDSIGGTTLTYTYDAAGRQLTQTGPNGSSASYTYDLVGNITIYQDQYGTTKYGYDAANDLTTITTPGGSCPASGNPANSGCIRIGYNANGAETSRSLPGGASIATTVDTAGRTTRIQAKNAAGTVVADVGYSFAAAGGSGSSADRDNIQSRISYAEQGITAGATTAYVYDSLGRLTSATEKAGTTTTAAWSYGYDADGNRTTQTRSGSTGATAGTTNYGYNAADELTSATGSTYSWTYDGNGDQTSNGLSGQVQALSDRQSVSSEGQTSYTDFAAGNTKLVSEGSTTYGFSTLGITGESGGNATAEYIRTPDGSPFAEVQNGGMYYFVTDALGSVVALIDSSGNFSGGYSYSPSGELRSSTNSSVLASNPIRFTGGYWDAASNLYRFGSRLYDPATGRFTQQDLSGQEKNPYAYGGDNPVNNVDPSGNSFYRDIEILVKLVGKADDFHELYEAIHSPEFGRILRGLAISYAIGLACEAFAASATVASAGLAAPANVLCVGIAIGFEDAYDGDFK